MPKSKMKNKRVGFLDFDFVTKKFNFYISYRDKKGRLRTRTVKGILGPKVTEILKKYDIIK